MGAKSVAFIFLLSVFIITLSHYTRIQLDSVRSRRSYFLVRLRNNSLLSDSLGDNYLHIWGWLVIDGVVHLLFSQFPCTLEAAAIAQ